MTRDEPTGTKPVDIPASGLSMEWRDSRTGVRSHILTEQVAPHQQSFYFVNASHSADGRVVWFYAFFPPAGSEAGGRTLGVLDMREGMVRHFPETQFIDGSPLVDPRTGEAYWVAGLEIWKRTPDPADDPVTVNQFSPELAASRPLKRLATHLTMSCDRRALTIDAQIGTRWYVGTAPVDGTPIEIWQEFDRCYNHAQFSPTDPDLQLLAQDWWHDPVTGRRHDYADRLWLIRHGEEARPIFPDDPSNRRTHEWWGADGLHVWYVDYERRTERVQVEIGTRTNVWPGGTCHSHCDAAGRFIVGDIGTYSWSRTGCRVAFFNTTTGTEIDIVSDLPEPFGSRGRYHVDPHPRFCLDDRYI